jgi:hypothetical protein
VARAGEWRAVLDQGEMIERSETGLKVGFPPSAQMAERVAGLCAAEVGCCSFLGFNLEIGAARFVLTVCVPDRPEATELVARVFRSDESAAT